MIQWAVAAFEAAAAVGKEASMVLTAMKRFSSICNWETSPVGIIFCNINAQAEFLCLQHPCGYWSPVVHQALGTYFLLKLFACFWLVSPQVQSRQLAQCNGPNNRTSSNTSSHSLCQLVFSLLHKKQDIHQTFQQQDTQWNTVLGESRSSCIAKQLHSLLSENSLNRSSMTEHHIFSQYHILSHMTDTWPGCKYCTR